MQQGLTEAENTCDSNITLIFTQPLKMIKTNHYGQREHEMLPFIIETLMIACLASDRG